MSLGFSTKIGIGALVGAIITVSGVVIWKASSLSQEESPEVIMQKCEDLWSSELGKIENESERTNVKRELTEKWCKENKSWR